MNMKNAAVDSPHLSGLPETHLGLGGYFFFFLTCFFHTTIHACSLLNSAICFCISSSFSKVIDFSGMILGLHRICSKDEKGVSKQLSLPLSVCLSLSLSLCSALLSALCVVSFASVVLCSSHNAMTLNLPHLVCAFQRKRDQTWVTLPGAATLLPLITPKQKSKPEKAKEGTRGRRKEKEKEERSVVQSSKHRKEK